MSAHECVIRLGYLEVEPTITEHLHSIRGEERWEE